MFASQIFTALHEQKDTFLIQATHQHGVLNLYPVQHVEQRCAYMIIAELLLLHMSKGETILSLIALAHSTSNLHTILLASYTVTQLLLGSCRAWCSAMGQSNLPYSVHHAFDCIICLVMCRLDLCKVWDSLLACCCCT